jgi:hypothetical protein
MACDLTKEVEDEEAADDAMAGYLIRLLKRGHVIGLVRRIVHRGNSADSLDNFMGKALLELVM